MDYSAFIDKYGSGSLAVNVSRKHALPFAERMLMSPESRNPNVMAALSTYRLYFILRTALLVIILGTLVYAWFQGAEILHSTQNAQSLTLTELYAPVLKHAFRASITESLLMEVFLVVMAQHFMVRAACALVLQLSLGTEQFFKLAVSKGALVIEPTELTGF